MKNIILIFLLLIFVFGCFGNAYVNEDFSLENKEVVKLEVFHFHGNNQCTSCKTVGAYAEETVNTYFQDELDNGIIVFDHINSDLLENSGLVIKYGVTGSSLWLGSYFEDNDFKAKENTNVWFKINDKADYMFYFKGVIEQELGD